MEVFLAPGICYQRWSRSKPFICSLCSVSISFNAMVPSGLGQSSHARQWQLWCQLPGSPVALLVSGRMELRGSDRWRALGDPCKDKLGAKSVEWRSRQSGKQGSWSCLVRFWIWFCSFNKDLMFHRLSINFLFTHLAKWVFLKVLKIYLNFKFQILIFLVNPGIIILVNPRKV